MELPRGGRRFWLKRPNVTLGSRADAGEAKSERRDVGRSRAWRPGAVPASGTRGPEESRRDLARHPCGTEPTNPGS